LEILAVQTLRNSLMSATMLASTATLALMGTLTLRVSSLHASFGEGAGSWPAFTPRLGVVLVVLGLLCASLVFSVLAVHYYNHASFIGGLPVETQARRKWNSLSATYARKAGLLYSWGLRQLILVVPAVAFILHPVAGAATAVVVVMVLASVDRAM
jgi:hypothetical protein